MGMSQQQMGIILDHKRQVYSMINGVLLSEEEKEYNRTISCACDGWRKHRYRMRKKNGTRTNNRDSKKES